MITKTHAAEIDTQDMEAYSQYLSVDTQRMLILQLQELTQLPDRGIAVITLRLANKTIKVQFEDSRNQLVQFSIRVLCCDPKTNILCKGQVTWTVNII